MKADAHASSLRKSRVRRASYRPPSVLFDEKDLNILVRVLLMIDNATHAPFRWRL